MSRPDLRSVVVAAMAEGARWLLAGIGAAMGAPAPACTRRRDALDRAAAAVSARGGGRRGWRYTDALRIGNRWTCVIEKEDTVYLVEVAVHSGAARVLTEVRKQVSVEGTPVTSDPPADGRTAASGRGATRFWSSGRGRLPRSRAGRRPAALQRPQPVAICPRGPQTPR